MAGTFQTVYFYEESVFNVRELRYLPGVPCKVLLEKG